MRRGVLLAEANAEGEASRQEKKTRAYPFVVAGFYYPNPRGRRKIVTIPSRSSGGPA